MSLVKGAQTVVIINGADISQYIKTSEFTRTKDTTDVTAYGPNVNDHSYSANLGDSQFTMSGNYDNTAGTGPRAVLRPLEDSGALTTLIRRPEGTGAGKPQDQMQVIVEKYVETNPVEGNVMWSADCKVSGGVTATTQ